MRARGQLRRVRLVGERGDRCADAVRASAPLPAAARSARDRAAGRTRPGRVPRGRRRLAGRAPVVISSSSAIRAACIGPAPPNATSAYWRGSTPRSTVTTRSAPSISWSAIRTMPDAVSATSSSSGGPALATARSAALGIEPHAARERRVGVEIAEQEVRVGDGRKRRRRLRSRPGPAAPQPTGGRRAGRRRVDPADAAAPGADRVHVDHRKLKDPPGDRSLGCLPDLAVVHDRHVTRGAAHVEREHVLRAPASAPRWAAPTAPPAGPESTVQAAWRAAAAAGTTPPLDCMISGSGSPASDARAGQPLEVAAQQRRQVGVDHGRRGSLVLAEHAEHLVRGRNVHARAAAPRAPPRRAARGSGRRRSEEG